MGDFLAKLVGLVVVGVIVLFLIWFGGLTWLAGNLVPDWTPETIQETYNQGPESQHWKMLKRSLAEADAMKERCRASAANSKHDADELPCAVIGRTVRAWAEWSASHPKEAATITAS